MFARFRYFSELATLFPEPEPIDLNIDTTTIAGCVKFLDTLTRAVVRGDVDTRKAQVLIGAVRSQAAIIEGQELERRIKRLETLLEAQGHEKSS